MKWRSLVGAALFASMATATAHPAAQTLTAAPTNPANGATSADLSQPMQWTSVANAQAYYLYVGTTVGAKDLVNTGEVQQTSYPAWNLPLGQTLYVRLWTKVAGVWRYVDTTFRASATLSAARLTYPADGATSVDLSQPMQWTSVASVQAYYLYVGTTAGGKDLVNSGEMQQTSYQAWNLPIGQTLYARLWTRVGGAWGYVDSTFRASAALSMARLTRPANGATNVDLSQPMQWTSVPNVQAYYLYVGTTVGAKDLVNSGEMQQTSYPAWNLPSGQPLYARLWTKIEGVWRYVDSTFVAAVLNVARLTYPADGATNVDLSQFMQWTSVANAQAYYLYVGRTVGAKDLVNTGETQQTSYQAWNVPLGQTLYVRLWTKVSGAWRYVDSTFSASSALSPPVATLTYPIDGATNADLSQPIRWTTVPHAQAYYLYVGTTQGAKNLVDTGETQQTWWARHTLPVNQTLYARMYTKVGGSWRYVDSTFTAASLAADFVYPQDGATGIDLTQPFQWTNAIGAEGYRLYVGTFPGGSDVHDSGDVAGTSYLASGLPSSGIYYARIWTKMNGSWARHSDIAFTSQAPDEPSVILTPPDGAVTFDSSQPFHWSEVPLARGYRLTIGTAAGLSDVHASGEIHVTQRFVPDLPIGVPLFGQLDTKINGYWYARSFTFRATANTVSSIAQIKSALWATDWVRRMAADDDRPYGWTELLPALGARYTALDADYVATLLRVLAEVNIRTTARRLDVRFNPALSDPHALVELLDPASLRWVLLDPAFGLSARRSDGAWATAEEVSTATLASNWSAISYVFLGAAEDAYVRNYYLDYPLLYLNVYHAGQPLVVGQGPSPLPYLQSVSLPALATPDAYAIRCTSSTTVADVVIDGTSRQVLCDGVDSISAAFHASSVAAPAGNGTPGFELYRIPRVVF